MKQVLIKSASAFAIVAGLSAGAQAASVTLSNGITVIDGGRASPTAPNVTQPVAVSSVGSVAIVVGQPGGSNPSQPNQGWDPFGTTDKTHSWYNLGDSNTSVTFNLSGPFAIVWGSPNNGGNSGQDNEVSFYTGLGGSGALIGTVTASDLYNHFSVNNTTDPGYRIGFQVPEAFKSVVVSTVPSAFEFAVTTGVPELSTWGMMLAGFAGLGLAGYRRNVRTRLVMSA
jgi:hypothetical protein